MADGATFTSKLESRVGLVTQSNNNTTKIIGFKTGIVPNQHDTVQTVETAVDNMSTGDVLLTDDYAVRLENEDKTNYVTVYAVYSDNSRIQIGKMYPGESWGPVRFPPKSPNYPYIQLLANTANCFVHVQVSGLGSPPT